MAGKLFLFTKACIISLVLLISSACTEDHYYTEYIEVDPSALWEVIDFEVRPTMWEWDNDGRFYYCIVDAPEMSKFIYNSGALIGYVFFGTQGVNETQILLPFHDNGRNIQLDYSYDLGQTIQFKFYWDDYARQNPGLYNFRIVFIY